MKKFCRQWLENWRQDCRQFRRWQRPCRNDRGAALLEFALGLPILLIITVFLFEMALFWEGRILGNHASFALARIAKVHYQPGLKKEEQVYFPEKCLLNSGYLETRARLQSQLSTERLVTAFFLFPVTRQKIGSSEEEIPTLYEITGLIPSFNDKLINAIGDIEYALSGALAENISEDVTSYLSGKITDITSNLFSAINFGNIFIKMIFQELTELAVSKLMTDIIQPILEDLLRSVFDFAIKPSKAVLQSYLAPLGSLLTGINQEVDRIKGTPGFLFADFMVNCYSRYDLACQRLNPNAGNGTKLEVWAEELIPEGSDYYYDKEENTGFWTNVKNWFASLKPAKSSNDAKDQYEDWKKEFQKNKNKTPGGLRFPRHATDAEAPAMVIAVSLTYPVKSHWFSLTAAAADDKDFATENKVAFTCNHATLAELPKQNIEEYFFEYKTIGQAGGEAVGKLIKDITGKINKTSKYEKIAKKTKINFPELAAWNKTQKKRRERQTNIDSELSSVESLFNDTGCEIPSSKKNYSRNIAGANTAIGNLDNAIIDANNTISDYTAQINNCLHIDCNCVLKKAIIEDLETFKQAAESLSTQLSNYINGTSKSPSYDKLVSDEKQAWEDLVQYYSSTLKTEIEYHRIGEEGKDPQASPDSSSNTPGKLGLDNKAKEEAEQKLLTSLQGGLNDSRSKIRKMILDAISNLTDYDLFNLTDPFDNNDPDDLIKDAFDADDTFKKLNEYYKIGNPTLEHFDPNSAK